MKSIEGWCELGVGRVLFDLVMFEGERKWDVIRPDNVNNGN